MNELFAAIPKVLLPLAADVERLVLRYAGFVEVDGTSYYNQFLLPPCVADYFGLRIGKKNYRWNTGPMGWSPMVFIGHSGLEVLLYDPKNNELSVETLGYIDNGYFFADDKKGSDDAVKRFFQRTHLVGGTFKITKEYSDKGDVLGRYVDCSAKTVSLQAKFVDKLVLLQDNLKTVWKELTHRELRRMSYPATSSTPDAHPMGLYG